MNAELLIPISLFLAIFGIFYVYLTTRNKEKMAMIEKGYDPIKFKTRPENGKEYGLLKLGMLCIGVAVGLLVAAILVSSTNMDEDAAYFASIFLFGGLGLLTSYAIITKKEKH